MTSRLASLPRFSLILAGLLALAACSSPDTPAPVADPVATESTAPAATAPGEAATPPAPATPSEPGPIVPPSGPAPVAGTHYVEIPNGQPYAPGSGRIEVVEVFGYTCPACANFEPVLKSWKARLPADVQVVPVAAPFGDFWMPYAKAFYAADSMNLIDQTHDAMFRAIHIERSLPVQGVSDEQIAGFYGRHGADAEQFASTMSSFAVDAQVRRAQQFLSRSGVDSTPTILVNGKYRVMSGVAYDEVLRITDHLIAMERAAAAGTEPAEDVPADAPASLIGSN